MKETKIAKENIEGLKDLLGRTRHSGEWICKIHKQTCERWLSFLIKTFGEDGFDMKESFDKIIHTKIIDLKQAIKLYDDAGI